MSKMYDSIHPELIPADATEVLAYTDGRFTNVATLRARFPNARLHTISAVGEVVGEWIDCETGCVWPPSSALSLYRAWRTQGCKGIYSNMSTQTLLKELLGQAANADLKPELFDADPGPDKVDPGNVATQYGFAGTYDITETSPAFEGDPPPIPSHLKENEMIIICLDGQPDYLVIGGHLVALDQPSLEQFTAAGVAVTHLSQPVYAAIVAKLA